MRKNPSAVVMLHLHSLLASMHLEQGRIRSQPPVLVTVLLQSSIGCMIQEAIVLGHLYCLRTVHACLT